MPTYNNPATMFGRNADMIPGQPFAGALAGLQGAYAQHAAEQGFRDTDLEFMASLNKYEEQLADAPMLAAKRDATIAESDTTSQWNRSGGALESKEAATGQVIAQTRATNESTDQKRRDAALEWANEAAQFASTYRGPLQNKAAVSQWREIRDEGEKLGMKVPDEAVPSAETAAKLNQKVAAARNNIAQQRRMMEQTQSQENALAVAKANIVGRAEVAADKNETARDLQESRAQMGRDVAQIRNERDTTIKTYTQMVIDNVATMIKKDMKDGQLSPETRRAAVAAAQLAAKEDLSKDQNYQLDVLRGNAGDPVAKKRAEDAMDKQVNYHLDTIPGFKQAEAISAGKVVSTPASPGAETKAQAILNKAREGGKNKGVSDEAILKAAKDKGLL